MARDEEMIVPLPNTFARAPVTTHIRSTLLVSSLGAITRHGFRDAYVKLVPPERLTTIETAVAGMWCWRRSETDPFAGQKLTHPAS